MANNAFKYPLINKESMDDIAFGLFAMHCSIQDKTKKIPTEKK